MSPYGDALVEWAGLANSEHLNASVHCDRGHNLCEAQDCLQGKQWFEPYVFIIKNSYYIAVFLVETTGLEPVTSCM